MKCEACDEDTLETLYKKDDHGNYKIRCWFCRTCGCMELDEDLTENEIWKRIHGQDAE